MEFQGRSGWFFQRLDWVARLAYVNLLWLAFTALGLVVLGLLPATIALFALLRQWLRGNEPVPIHRAFWEVYRADFWKANRLGLVLAAPAGWLYLALAALGASESTVARLAQYLLFGVAIMYGVTLLYCPPVFAHLELPVGGIVRAAFVLGVSHPLQSLLMVAGGAVALLAMLAVPGVLPFFGVSLPALWVMWLAHRILLRLELEAEA